MNHQEMFDVWKKHREKINVTAGLPERVMARLREYPAPRRGAIPVAASVFLLGRIVARPWARATVVILGVLAGLARIAMTLDLILRV